MVWREKWNQRIVQNIVLALVGQVLGLYSRDPLPCNLMTCTTDENLSLSFRWYERAAVFRKCNAIERYSSAKGDYKPSILIGLWSKTLADCQSNAEPSRSKSKPIRSGLLPSTLWIFETDVLSHSFQFAGNKLQEINALQMSQRWSLFVKGWPCLYGTVVDSLVHVSSCVSLFSVSLMASYLLLSMGIALSLR